MTSPSSRPPRSRTLARAFGFTRLIVELGVFSSFAFSLALFVAAIVQAYHTIGDAFRHLGEEGTTKHLLIAAVEQTDTLLVGMALLIISLGLQALFIGEVRNVPAWLHVQTFDDLKQKLIGIVITALGVNFFSVALEWHSGPDILSYGAAIAAVILAVGTYSLVLARQGAGQDSLPAHGEADAGPHP
ncbi:YqhA family protein [Deinococcus aestuarii]|uniref:YqhA family protein n=1 Tax=Deinococcus aestuarii TaxID=2774531 RepID=UPI001C0E780E